MPVYSFNDKARAMYAAMVIVGIIWFLGLIPLLLWSVSGSSDHFTVSIMDTVKWGLFLGGVILSPALMLLGGWLAPDSDSDWPMLGRAAGAPAAFLCWGISVMFIIPEDTKIERLVHAGCCTFFVLLGLGTSVVAGFAAAAGDLGFGIGGIVGGLLMAVFGVGLVRAVWTNRDTDMDWAVNRGGKLLAYGAIFFGGSIALLGIPVAWRLGDWKFLLGSLAVGAVFLYRGSQMLDSLD